MTEEGNKSSQEEDRDINDDMENWKLTSRLNRIRKAQKDVEDKYRKQIEERNKTLHENWKERTSQYDDQSDEEEDKNSDDDDDDKQQSDYEQDDGKNNKENEHSWKTENDFARVKFALPDGRTVTKYFYPGSTLEQLYEAAQTLLPSTWQSRSLSLTAKAPWRTLDDIGKDETLQELGFVPSGTVMVQPIKKKESYSWMLRVALICCLAVLGAFLYLYVPSIMSNDTVPEDSNGKKEHSFEPTTEVSIRHHQRDYFLTEVYMYYWNYWPFYWHPSYTVVDWLKYSIFPWLYTVFCLFCLVNVLWYN